jgi:hypothetical protein
MDTESDLNRLVQLRNNGVITEREFRKKQRAILRGPPSYWRGWWWRIPLLLLIIWQFYNFITTIDDKHVSASNNDIPGHKLPACDDDAVKDAIQRIIENKTSDAIKQDSLVDWRDVEVTGEATKDEKYCKAHLFLRTGETDVAFKLFYANEKSENWVLQITRDTPDQ